MYNELVEMESKSYKQIHEVKRLYGEEGSEERARFEKQLLHQLHADPLYRHFDTGEYFVGYDSYQNIVEYYACGWAHE
jgi:hypothetical protein